MRQNHVKIFYIHAKGDGWVSAAESAITFVRAYTVNDVFVDCAWAEFTFDPFGEIRLKRLPHGERQLQHPSLVEPYEAMLDSLTAEDWMDSTTEDVIVLPVSSLEFIEKPEGTYADMLPA